MHHHSAFPKQPLRPEWKKMLYYWLQVILLAIVYHVTALLGIFLLDEGQRGVVLLSLPAGVALAALWLFGITLWPGIVLGLFLFKISMSVPIIFILFDAVGKVLEAFVAVWLLRHFQFQTTLARVYDVLLFFIVVLLISPLLSASISTLGMWYSFAEWISPKYLSEIWLVIWLSDGIGMLVITSTLLIWQKLPPFLQDNLRLLESSLLFICLTVISALALKVENSNRLILLYTILPFAVWAAIRFEQHGATLSALLISSILINGGLDRILPLTARVKDLTYVFSSTFEKENFHIALLEIGFIAITTSTALLVAAAYSEQRQLVKKLLRKKQRLLTTFHSMADAVITTNAMGLVTYINPVAEGLTGWSNKHAKSKLITDIFRIKREWGNTSENLVERCLHGVISPYHFNILINREHQEKIIESSFAPIRNRYGTIEGMIVIFHEVNEKYKQNAHLITYDTLTGLYNRSEFEYQLKVLLYQSKIMPASHMLFHLNLDQFKQINTHYGHLVGDLLLKQWVLFLKERVRAGDIFARLESDNFAVLLKHCAIDHAKTVASHFIKATQEFELSVDQQMIKISVSIGAVPIHACSENFMQILNSAELACCAAKEQGGNQVYVHQNHFTPTQR